MANPSRLRIEGTRLTSDVQGQPSPVRRGDPGPVRIGLIADLRGRGSDDPSPAGRPLTDRRLHRVDRDRLDEVLARLEPRLALDVPNSGSAAIELEFHALEDFHPDRILAQTAVFAELRSLRRRLENPSTYAAAAAELGVGDEPHESGSKPEPAPTPVPVPKPESVPGYGAAVKDEGSSSDLLDRILDQDQPRSPAPVRRPSGALGEFLKTLVAPHIVHENPRQAEVIAGVDEALGRLMREILHHPRFQSLEATWRGIHLLTDRLETGAGLTIELLDLTREELEADLLSETPLESTAAYKLLVEPTTGTSGGHPWTLLVGDLTFGPSLADVALLWRLGQLARLAGAPFVAAASSALVGCESVAATPDPDDWETPEPDESWSDLRQSEEAPYLGLVLPRFLLRSPYGAESVPIDSFSFEEVPALPPHESYLWGNPAFAVALLVAQALDASGGFQPDRYDPHLLDLPLPLERDDDGELSSKPCAEAVLGSKAERRLLEAGLMPLMSVRDRDEVCLARLASIAEPPAPLAFA